MSFSFRSVLVRVFSVAALVTLMSFAVHAQSNVFGGVNGVVSDAQNKVVVGATVTVRNVNTNISSKPVTTDDHGGFFITDLQPGVYEVDVKAANFADFKRENVIVEVGKSTNVDATLGVAGSTQTVSVTAEAPVINTEQNDFSTNMNKASIDNLPISIRRWSYFVLATPGAVADGTFGDISFRGISGLLNNNTVDGADNNEAFFSEEKGRTRIDYSSSLNSVQEFQVNTSNYSAEYGRAAGGVVNAVTKSGTNSLHADLFYYDRDAGWGAYAPFNTGAVQSSPGVFTTVPLKPKDVRQQFGGDAGGWLIKNKLFWYFNYDGVVRHFPGVAIPNGPATFFSAITVAAPSGTNPNGTAFGCTNSNTPSGGTTTVVEGTYSGNNGFISGKTNALTIGQTLFCRGITQTQANQALSFLDSLTGEVTRTGDQGIFFPKIDWHVNDNNVITFSYNRLRWNSPYGIQTADNVARGVDSFGNDYVKDDTAIIRWTSTWGPSLSNELRYDWGRDFEFELTTPSITGEPVSSVTGFSPGVSFGGYSMNDTAGISWTFGVPNFLNRADYPHEEKNEAADTISYTHGKHLIKAGFDEYRTGDIISNLFEGFGIYSYSNMADYISDYVAKVDALNPGETAATTGMVCQSNTGSSASPVLVYIPCYSSYSQGFGPAGFDFRTWDSSFFVQDDYHATRRLTIDLGLRWEHETAPRNPIPNALVPLSGVMPHGNKDFGPRAGFAWDTFGDGKTLILRGGAGIYYGRIINEQIYGAITNDGSASSQIAQTIFPTTGSSNNIGTFTPGAPVYAQSLPTFNPSAGAPSIVYFAGDARLPQIDQFDLTAEHEIAQNTVISISYVGAFGRFLPMGVDQNLPTTETNETFTIAGTPPSIGGTALTSQLPAPGSTFTVPVYLGGNPARPNKNFQQMIELTTKANSWYNAGVVQLNRRLQHGLQVQANYTYSHAIDTDQSSSALITGNTPLDPANIAQDRGNSNFDVRHRFVTSLVYQPPFFEGKDSNKIAHWVLSGWTISPVQTIQTGMPFSGAVSGSPSGTTLGVIGANGSSRVPFIGRNSFRMPALFNTDLRVARDFQIHERLKLEVSAELFNVWNNFVVTGLNTTLFSASGTQSAPVLTYQSSFDTPTAANNAVFLTQRLIQLGARLSF